MTYGSNDQQHQHRVHSAVRKNGGPFTGVLGTVVGWINSLAGHLPGFLQGPFKLWVRAETFLPDLVAREWDWIFHTLERLFTWILITLPRMIRREINRGIKALRWWANGQFRQLRRLIMRVLYVALTYAYGLVARERRQRARADQRLAAESRQLVKALHQQIEREAVAGYKPAQSQRLDLIQRVADLIAVNDPLTKRLVSDLVSGVLDLAAVDDPLARFGLSFLLKHVIDRLGIDKPIGELLARLLEPILGAPKPIGLTPVIADISTRLGAVEASWADFMDAGGPEVEQAGREWKDLAGPVADIGLLAFFGLAVSEPNAWATAVNDTLGVIISDTLTGAVNLIRKA